MADDFKNKINNIFGGFLCEKRLKQISYRYDEQVFGNGVAEYVGPKKIHLRIIRERSHWHIEMKRARKSLDTWFDLFDYLIYKSEDYKDTRELVYSGKMKEEAQLQELQMLLEKKYAELIEILKDEMKAKPFYEYFQKPIKFN